MPGMILGTPPPKRRRLTKSISEPKAEDLARARRAPPAASGAAEKGAAARAGEEDVPIGSEAAEAAFAAELEHCGVPAASRARLLPLLHRWGPARAPQVLDLWTRLGDGASKRPASAGLQVWGPAGSGKTEVVFGYMNTLGIRHVRLNCACFCSVGELHTRLAEGLRLAALEALGAAGREAPKELLQRQPAGRQLRTLDRLEAAVRLPLECFAQAAVDGGSGKLWVVLDHAQELQRLDASALNLLLSLPEVLKHGKQIAVVTISRLKLTSLGVLQEREPPVVTFPAYGEAEAEAILTRQLKRRAAQSGRDVPQEELQMLCRNGLIKFAAKELGCNLQQLLFIGEEVLQKAAGADAPLGLAALQQLVDRAVRRRTECVGIGDLLPKGEGREERLDDASGSAIVTMRRMTNAEKRLLLAAYLASRIDKEDDQQLFLPSSRRKQRRKPRDRRRAGDDQPVFTRPPQPVPLMRLMAVYHQLARQPQLLGPPLFEHIMSLREAGLLRFVGDRGPGWSPGCERDPKVLCRAELPLARACAGDLNVDLAEYLCAF